MNKADKYLIFFLIPVSLLILLAAVSGCGSSSSSGGGPHAISKIYLAGRGNDIVVFDPEALTYEASIIISGAQTIYGVSANPNQNIIYAVDSSASNRKIYSYNTQTLSLSDINVSGYDPSGFGRYSAISPNGAYVFAPAKSKAGIFAFDASPLSLEKFATAEPIGSDWSFSAVADNNFAYFVDSSTKAVIFKYNISSKTIAASLEVPSGGGPWFLKFNPQGNKIYVPISNQNKVSVIDVGSFNFEAQPISVGNYPTDIGFSSGGKAYVVNFNDGSVSVINTSTGSVTNTITHQRLSGTSPNSIIVDEARQRIYLNSTTRKLISVIDMTSETFTTTLELPSATDQMSAK